MLVFAAAFSTGGLGKTRSAALQGTREVEGLVFSMVSDIGKLKRKVDLLGSPKDTLSHRCAGITAGCWTPSLTAGGVTACRAGLSLLHAYVMTVATASSPAFHIFPLQWYTSFTTHSSKK